MKKIIFLISWVLFSTVFLSCEGDDFLTEETLQEQVNNDAYNTDEDDTDDVLQEPDDD
ncbi:MAG: hypothetical protein L3J09_10190 [Flavobacteriaceae bacterium]|nr:hypothetical protein [Flavobacteriaceae bacterium]